MKPTISKPFKSNDRTFDKVYNAFDKRDYFNSQGLAKVQIGNFERALKKNDKGAQQILDMFKGDEKKAKDYITQVISDRNKERAFNNYKALKDAVDSIQKGKPNVGAVDYVKRIIHNSSQKYSIALYSTLRNKKFTKWKDVHNDIDSLIGEGSVNEILFIVDKFDKKKQDYGKVYYQDGGKRPGDGDLKKANKELERLSKKHKGLTLVSVGRNSKMYDVHNPRESVNEGPSREEFRIAAMAIRKQAKFRNVSPEQAIQDQLNALKLLQRYIKKGDVKKYTGMNLSEAKFEVGKVYDNPYHTAFKSSEQINEEDDHEVGMGLSSLKSSVRSAKVIYDNIKKRNIEELDGWVQEKLTLASDYLKNVADYMEDLDEYDKDGNNN